MRLDLFLKYSCLVARRSVAKRLCDSGGILLNRRVAKASSPVAAGDMVELTLGSRRKTIEVMGVPVRQAAKRAAPALFRLVAEHAVEE